MIDRWTNRLIVSPINESNGWTDEQTNTVETLRNTIGNAKKNTVIEIQYGNEFFFFVRLVFNFCWDKSTWASDEVWENWLSVCFAKTIYQSRLQHFSKTHIFERISRQIQSQKEFSGKSPQVQIFKNNNIICNKIPTRHQSIQNLWTKKVKTSHLIIPNSPIQTEAAAT